MTSRSSLICALKAFGRLPIAYRRSALQTTTSLIESPNNVGSTHVGYGAILSARAALSSRHS